jgi:ABC-2 type transport system permease protein
VSVSESAAPQWFVIARREFLERVRSAWFVVVTVLGPLLILGLLVIPAWLSYESARDEVKIAIVDRSAHGIGDWLATEVNRLNLNFTFESVDADTSHEELGARVRARDLNGFLVFPEDLLEGGRAVYRGDNATNMALKYGLEELLTAVAVRVRAGELGLSEAQADALARRVQVEAIQDTGTGVASSGVQSFIVSYLAMGVLYMAILLYAVNVMRSVVQEKTSRVVELVVSSTRPRALMLGKIIGVGGVGLFQLAIWLLFALVLVKFRVEILGLFGLGGIGDFDVPPLTVADVGVILVFFVGGFVFYAALYAAVGAMVNSDQEAQQAQTPVMIVLIIPAVCVHLVANDPRGSVAELLTTIPFSSPILMPMRYLLGGAGPVDLAISLVLLAAGIVAAVWLAARIYRVGILMYGKRPTLRELTRWLRHG